jgi:hypothetical protein
MNDLIGYRERPAKLILNRRHIAAGLAALLGVPATAAADAMDKLAPMTRMPLNFDADEFTSMTRNGVFLPDYRHPMVRVVFDTGQTTAWHRYNNLAYGKRSDGTPRSLRPNATCPVAIETCAPDKNGMPRYASLNIG